MLKKLFFIYLLLITSIFANIEKDELNFFNENQISKINKKIKNIEKERKVNIKIFILKEEPENQLIKDKKSVIILLFKKENGNIGINLKFTNDINIIDYKSEIDNLLEDLSPLIINKEYEDFIYELLANISDILIFVEKENNDAIGTIEKNKENQKIILKNILNLILILFLMIVLGFVIYTLYLFYIKSRDKTKCKDCNINMHIVDKIENKSGIIKIYECPKCKKIKQIIEKK
ncbi:hypothetical protein EV215_1937 [Hypnocyclicus thermotrophus]|uniref:TPM domain-containing protein n=1 Tax=Hypnocyclicus thermotrophus TaxID=1627895 RepID=A0AA46DXA1_9FUSO|nr:hypothetical protein [Hypnocyclicus thermotrophus]TDT67931.1 hypothetical protein EV215_1937 [Hypnocyclicus thermotrophus]